METPGILLRHRIQNISLVETRRILKHILTRSTVTIWIDVVLKLMKVIKNDKF